MSPRSFKPDSSLGSLGEVVRTLCAEAGLTQEGLAAQADIDASHIERGDLELGRRLPRLDTILQLAASTNVSICLLLEGMEWRPGRHVDGDFYVEPPAGGLRRGVQC